MSPPKSWIYTRSRNHPPDGSLRLGQILSEANNPLSARITSKGDLVPDRIQVDLSSHDYKHKQSSELEATWKSWIKVSGAYLAARSLGRVSNKRLEDWVVEELHGQVMPLDDKFAKEMLKHDNVVSYTNQKHGLFGRKGTGKLFMVTGIRWAKGGSLNKSSVTAVAAGGAGQADLGQAGIPVQVGADGAVGYRNEDAESITKGTDFVLQYALHEIRYGVNYKAKPYTHGETESADEDAQSDDSAADEIESLSFIAFVEAKAPPQEIEIEQRAPQQPAVEEGAPREPSNADLVPQRQANAVTAWLGWCISWLPWTWHNIARLSRRCLGLFSSIFWSA